MGRLGVLASVMWNSASQSMISDQQHHLTWEPVRHADSWVHFTPTELEALGVAQHVF